MTHLRDYNSVLGSSPVAYVEGEVTLDPFVEVLVVAGAGPYNVTLMPGVDGKVLYVRGQYDDSLGTCSILTAPGDGMTVAGPTPTISDGSTYVLRFSESGSISTWVATLTGFVS